jgi:hypothetical protein
MVVNILNGYKYMKFININGYKFGRLTVTGFYGPKGDKLYWYCVCDCGNKDIVSGSNLKGGYVRSCGCMRTDHMKRGPEHHKWVGDNVQYEGVHGWVKRNIKTKKVCSVCKTRKNIDLANKDNLYNRDFNNWTWLCRKHHMLSDGRINT